ncbi:MAG: tRNA (cytidine(34)-2'-O)-methyltransferase [Sphaerochaetaceae bacterium]
MGLHIVLFEPEIPQNTGNIARTCAATGATLHLVHPLGFSIDSKQLKRAGLDYWHLLSIVEYADIGEFLSLHGDKQLWFYTAKAERLYCDVQYAPDTYLVFGKESVGLPEEILVRYPAQCIRIPIIKEARSLNLSNTVAIGAFEYERQQGFPGLSDKGSLNHLTWPANLAVSQ